MLSMLGPRVSYRIDDFFLFEMVSQAFREERNQRTVVFTSHVIHSMSAITRHLHKSAGICFSEWVRWFSGVAMLKRQIQAVRLELELQHRFQLDLFLCSNLRRYQANAHWTLLLLLSSKCCPLISFNRHPNPRLVQARKDLHCRRQCMHMHLSTQLCVDGKFQSCVL